MNRKKSPGIFVPRASFYLWIIFVLVVIVGILNLWAAIPGYLLLVFLVYYNFRSNHLRHKEITSYIENLTFNIDAATKDTLLNFPMPLVVVELDGTIIWYNSSFKRVFEGEALLEKTISSFVEELHPGNLINEAANISKEIAINNRHYHAVGNFAKIDGKDDENGYMLMLYLIENTELVELKKRYADEKIAVGIIIIDNYDDLMQSMEDTSRPQMLAEIDKKIMQWTSFTGGVFKKFERDKYLAVFEFSISRNLKKRNLRF